MVTSFNSHGNLADAIFDLETLCLEHKTLAFLMFTLNLLSPSPSFQFFNLASSSLSDSATMTRLLVYNSSHGQPVLNSQVVPLENVLQGIKKGITIEKGITITNAIQKILEESGCKPNKISTDEGSKFCNRSLKSWLLDKDIEMYSTHNEGNSVVC